MSILICCIHTISPPPHPPPPLWRTTRAIRCLPGAHSNKTAFNHVELEIVWSWEGRWRTSRAYRLLFYLAKRRLSEEGRQQEQSGNKRYVYPDGVIFHTGNPYSSSSTTTATTATTLPRQEPPLSPAMGSQSTTAGRKATRPKVITTTGTTIVNNGSINPPTTLSPLATSKPRVGPLS